MALALQHHLHAHLHPLVAAQFEIDQKVTDTRHQVLLVIGFDDEVVGAAGQAMHHIPRIGQAGDQDHREAGGLWIPLELATQFVAIHLGHHDVADDDGRRVLGDTRQGLDPIARDPYPAPGRLEQVLQLGSLGRAVLDYQDFGVGVHDPPPSGTTLREPLRSEIELSSAAISSGGSTLRAACRLMAASGMASITALAGSWTMVRAPLRCNSARPSAPSRPMPDN
ncbi:hypothetical protein D9M68_764570 [compost metagenome]